MGVCNDSLGAHGLLADWRRADGWPLIPDRLVLDRSLGLAEEQPDECACLMLINKPEEDDGITGQFNHLCRTHPAAATSSNASPRAPRQIFEAWHFTPAGTRYRLSTRSLYTLSTLSLDSRQPLSSRPPAPSASQRAPTHAAQGPATPRPSAGSCCRPPTGARRQGQRRAPTGRPGGHPSVEGRTRAAREVLSELALSIRRVVACRGAESRSDWPSPSAPGVRRSRIRPPPIGEEEPYPTNGSAWLRDWCPPC